MNISRKITAQIRADLSSFPITAILGPRQCGKTTLAKSLLPDSALYLDLQKPSDLNKLQDAETFLSHHQGRLVCLDEVQLRPDLFPLLRSLVDENRKISSQFLILGSSSPELLRQSSESLAGRIAFNYLTPFSALELPEDCSWKTRLHRGGFPDSLLSESDKLSLRWRENYVTTFLERDLKTFGVTQEPVELRRLWEMVCHINGQTINYSKLASSLDKSHPTIKSHLDILESTFMLRRLPAFHINTKKRLIKTPKLYFRDSGILCYLMGVTSFDSLLTHPGLGACWEGHCIENIIGNLLNREIYGFFRTKTGAEIDLVVKRNGELYGFEFKVSSAPSVNKFNKEASEVLGLKKLYLVCPEVERFKASPGVEVVSLSELLVSPEW